MSVTGQVGHVALALQSAFGTANTTASAYKAVKITGDSLVASNNMLVAEGEIGTGRDVTQAVPGGFSAQGAINGNLTSRAASILLHGVLGTGASGTIVDNYTPGNTLPVFTVEKQVGSTARSASEQLVVRYTDVMVNTLNVSANSGGLSTFSAGLIACQEGYQSSPLVTEPIAYPAASNDLLVFHGGRIRTKDSTDSDTVTFASGNNDPSFQSLEVAINNNVDASEYTIRPSRFLRSLTEGIRNVEINCTIVFDDYAKYQQYTYGATGNTSPGYSLYVGAMNFVLANWQLGGTNTAGEGENLSTSSPTNGPTNPQGVEITLPKLAFSGLPVALTSGRIAVSTTARALKPNTGNIVKALVRPAGVAFV